MIAQALSRTVELARFAASYPEQDIPGAVRERALALLIDLVGSIVRAAAASESTPSILRTVERAGLAGDPRCTVFGLDRRYGPAAAALLNGALGHSLDFDDTHAHSSLHSSATVVPAALAVGELTGATGGSLLSAIIVGHEVSCRLGNALDPSAHYARGFHPTATAGVFGACAAAGRLLGLDEAGMAAGFGIAASQASGSLQFLENGAWNKRYQVGEAAMKGVLAAMLAAEGFHGASDGIDGRYGFLSSYSDGARPELATAGLGTVWETMRIGLKPYPACRYTHAAVDGLIDLVAKSSIRAGEIRSISVGLHRNGVALVGEPLAEKQRPRSIVAGQFSMPFAAAVSLLRGRFGWDDYELLGTAEADALCDRVQVFRDPSLEGVGHPFGATLRVATDNEVFELRLADPSGEPETFPTSDMVAAKFLTLAAPVLGKEADTLLRRLQELPSAGDLGDWFQPVDAMARNERRASAL